MDTEITLDKPRRLRFDLAAFKDLEAAMGGVPLGTIYRQIQQFGLTAISLALWAGLKHEDRALTRPLTDTIFETYLTGGGRVSTVTTALMEAIDASGLFGGPEGNAPASATTSPS